jgi:hypothetical protein
MRILQTRVVEKLETHILSWMTFFRKSCNLWDVEKCIAGQATDGNIILRMRFACWIPKATNSHTGCVILLLLHYNNGFTNAPQCYVYKYVAWLVTAVLRFSSASYCFNSPPYSVPPSYNYFYSTVGFYSRGLHCGLTSDPERDRTSWTTTHVLHPPLVLRIFSLTPLTNLHHFLTWHSPIVHLTPFGWLYSITLTPNF